MLEHFISYVMEDHVTTCCISQHNYTFGFAALIYALLTNHHDHQ